ncbi:MAG: toll/interleukin-1 receptor domain-containing protein [Planctomycetaceae bacterium]|nr:toll/interleukin-1 receptor domain-containing protein [Planctomycetaceae bacterium]
MNRVYISYAHRDKEYADHVLSELREKGLMTEEETALEDRAEDIETSDSVCSVLQNKIRQAVKIIFIINENSLKSPWVNYEIGLARALEKQMTIVTTKTLFAQLPAFLLGEQVIIVDNIKTPLSADDSNSVEIETFVAAPYKRHWTTAFERLRERIKKTMGDKSSQWYSDLSSRIEAKKRLAEAAEIAAQAKSAADEAKLKEVQKVFNMLDSVFADDRLSESIKKLKLAKLIESNPQILRELEAAVDSLMKRLSSGKELSSSRHDEPECSEKIENDLEP